MNREHKIRTPGATDSESPRRGRVLCWLSGAGEALGAVASYRGPDGRETRDDSSRDYIDRSWLLG
ncbi:MAG: hypothetical protein QF357_06050 [Dehalococcoidia bacterium]|jgi:hypothetical protein|nr:hypothetical protein [Dehalococcoidia bacterium]